FLTKTSALFAFPVLLLFIWRQREERREKLISTGIFALTAIILLANYAWLVTRLYPADYAYFTSLNINGRIALQPLDILHNLLKSLSRGFYIDKIMYPLIALLTPILLWRFPKFRQNDLIIMSVLWIASYFALVGTSTYQPPRYFIPLGVPIIILFSVSSFSLHKQLKHPLYTKALAATVTLILLMNVFQIGRYLQSPEYTFQDMATDIQHQIPAGSIIYGHMANSVGLATGNYSINERHGTQPNEWKFEQYKPTYYVALGETDTQFLLDAQYDVHLLADYAVFNNHASDKKVYLYQLIKRK
ncbi:MAG: hypothetical protein KAG66_19960, partial [Methylococcales bacterium]|nr:hypothetical protein [Methylococcales bacterium]